MSTKLIVIFGDQLSLNISSLQTVNPTKDMILMCELKNEAEYVKHHKMKIAFIFSAMRHFSGTLVNKGYNVTYVRLDDKENTGNFYHEVERICKLSSIDEIVLTEPSEYRVLSDIWTWQKKLNKTVNILEDDRFLCSKDEFKVWASGKKQLRMEFFYREMRKKLDVLMTDKVNPEGGKWNYDSENRKSPNLNLDIPNPHITKIDSITEEVIELVKENFADHFGKLENFYFAVTRLDALKVLAQFVQERLVYFGDYQDAMIENEPWMFHSHISFYLNCGLLTPLECVKASLVAYADKKVPLNAVEGFIRQIIGWREYIRGIYWLKMPSYKQLNFLGSTRKLPQFFWNGNTKLNCLKQCISETEKHAYAHHIQRLMVLGNFSLLAELDPKDVNEWYLIVYADAYEWVELPNVTGMILFADGGVVASKPYAAGGAYINKMSNYCKNCCYSVTKKTGDKACPFNYLYWNFLYKKRPLLEKNPRVAMMYRTWDRMDEEKKTEIIKSAERFLELL